MSEESGTISKGLNTLLKLETFERLTKYAKETCSDPFGKWSYSIAFDKLLDLAENDKRYFKQQERIDFLEYKMMEFEAKLGVEDKTTPDAPEGAKRKPVKVLGGELK